MENNIIEHSERMAKSRIAYKVLNITLTGPTES